VQWDQAKLRTDVRLLTWYFPYEGIRPAELARLIEGKETGRLTSTRVASGAEPQPAVPLLPAPGGGGGGGNAGVVQLADKLPGDEQYEGLLLSGRSSADGQGVLAMPEGMTVAPSDQVCIVLNTPRTGKPGHVLRVGSYYPCVIHGPNAAGRMVVSIAASVELQWGLANADWSQGSETISITPIVSHQDQTPSGAAITAHVTYGGTPPIFTKISQGDVLPYIPFGDDQEGQQTVSKGLLLPVRTFYDTTGSIGTHSATTADEASMAEYQYKTVTETRAWRVAYDSSNLYVYTRTEVLKHGVKENASAETRLSIPLSSLGVEVTHVSDVRYDAANRKFQKKTQAVRVLSASAESAWTDVYTAQLSCQ
jgi:hypothetical protein